MTFTFYKGDCLQSLKSVPSHSINLIYFDPPFGTTRNSWDSILPWNKLFEEFDRVLVSDGNIVIHCSIPFNYTLIRNAPRPPSYSWYWKKENITCPLIAKIQPLRNTEEILVWKGKKAKYYPQRVGTEERIITSNGSGSYYGTTTEQYSQKVIGKYQAHHLDYKRTFDTFSTRPTELIELIIKSYTKEGDKVLDPTCYKGISGVVTTQLQRNWIGMDLYFYPILLLNGTSKNP